MPGQGVTRGARFPVWHAEFISVSCRAGNSLHYILTIRYLPFFGHAERGLVRRCITLETATDDSKRLAATESRVPQSNLGDELGRHTGRSAWSAARPP
jgi:hypothetical protein